MRTALLAIALTLLAALAAVPAADAQPIPTVPPVYCSWSLPYGDQTFYLVCAELNEAIDAYNHLAGYLNCYLNTAPTGWLLICT